MLAVRRLRRPVLVLLCLAIASCTRMAPEDDGLHPEVVDAQPDAVEGRSTRGGEPSTAEPRSAPAMEIGTGQESVRLRRRMLMASENALDPEALGYFMDVHEARLLQSLGEPVRLRRENGAFHLRISSRTTFVAGSAQLNEDLERELESLADVLVEFDHTLIVVRAHTDASGPTDYNQALSERRALRVAQTLVDRGLDSRRVVAVGYGESRPIADNDTAGGRARNRRVEILVEAIVREPQG